MKKLFTLFATAMILLGVQNVNAAVEYTALSGSNWGHASESPTALFDGKGTTKWGTTASDANKPYVVFKTSRAIKPTSYRVIIANDTNSNTGRNWKSWRIFGGNFASDDAATSALEAAWDLIDTKENQELSTAQYAEQYRDLSETLSTSYSYFKIIIDSDVSHWSGWCQMGDFAFICAPAKDANNNYLISTAAELDDFSFLVSSGKEANAKGKLTADIDASGFAYTPIGTSSHKYTGTFDGDGHYIKLGINSSSRYQGLFGYANGGASFSNLIIKGSVKGAGSCAALVGEVGGSGTVKITCVGCEADVTSTADRNGAFVGNNNGGGIKLEVKNCYNTGYIHEDTGGGYTSLMGGWSSSSSTYENVYNIGTIDGGSYHFVWNNWGTCTNCYTTSSQATAISGLTSDIVESRYTSGQLCYELNGSENDGTTWKQTIGSDGYPVLFGTSQTVHQASTGCYTNLPVSGGKVQIGIADNLKKFAAEVNAGNSAMNAELTDDIDVSTVTYTPIGTSSHKYTGTFDGDGHYIKLGINSSSSQQGLVAYANGGASFSNLIIKGSINGGANCAALICVANGSGTININRVGCEVDITSTGNANAAFVGNDNGGSVQIIIQNSYNTGDITGSGESSAIGGWMRKNSQFTNVYNTGTVSAGKDEYNRFAYFYNGDGSPTFTRCYTKTPNAGNFTGPTTGITTIVSSGELCYLLNESIGDGTTWTQTIGTDGHPVLFPASRTVHQYSASIYTNLPVSEGKIQIANSTDLKQFASEVNAGNAAIDAVLTGDINMFGESWPVPIGYWGSGYIMYGGHFNGQGHTINNLTYTTTQNYHGLFGVITTGALIENFNINGTITNNSNNYFGTIGFARDTNPAIRNVHSSLNINSASGKMIGGILGQTFNGTVTIDRCIYSGTISVNDTGSSGEYGGILGYNNNNASVFANISNCLFDGAITNSAGTPGAVPCGGIVGLADSSAKLVISNCLSVGAITAGATVSGQICGKNNSTHAETAYSDTYYNGTYKDGTASTTTNKVATSVSDAQLANGEVCYLLNGSVNAGKNWYQDLSGSDAHPYPFGSKTVSAGQWFNDADNDVYYNLEDGNYTVYQLNMSDTNTKYAVPANVTAKNVNITRTIPEDQWIGLCLPFDYDIPSGWTVCEFDHINGSGGNAVMSFTTASSIEAGKPYLVKPETEVTSITITDTDTDIISATDAADDNTVSIGGVNMIGNLAQTSISTGDYYINTSSALKKLTAASANLKGFRAYFTVDGESPVKALNFMFDEDATSLSEELRVKSEEFDCYDLSGRKINSHLSPLTSQLKKGIYIVNGKKVLF